MELSIAHFEPEAFQYEPLPTPSSIRLLTLFNVRRRNRPLRKSAPVEGILRTVDLADEPVYKALSYVWGNPFGRAADPEHDPYDTQWPLVINGRLLFVGRSLSKALRDLLALPPEAWGIDKRLLPFGMTELVRSSEMGNVKRVKYCLARGADVHAKDQHSMTALHYAAAKGHHRVVELLLLHGADPDLLDDHRRTPLTLATTELTGGRRDDIIRLLREASREFTKPTADNADSDEDDIFAFDLWIDGICINQNDLAERNAQVAMMDRIYSVSIASVVWLGYASKKTAETLAIVAKKDDEPWITPAPPDTDAVLNQKRAAMDLLAGRTWFKRRWIIQEFCLAQDVEMFCGQVEIDTKRLPLFGPVKVNFLLGLRNWYLFHSATRFPDKEPLPGLIPLVIVTWGYESGDPRDSVFSLLGLAKRSTETGTLGDEIVADYAKPVAQVFLEVGRLLMETRVDIHATFWKGGVVQPLDGLALVQNRPGNAGRIDGTPSWVPNFHQNIQTLRIPNHRFYASGKDTPIRIWPSEMAVLKVDAWTLDTISRVEKVHVPGKGFTPNLSAWFEMASNEGVQVSVGDDPGVRIEALWRALMVDDDDFLQYGGDAFEPVPRQSFKNYLSKHLHTLRYEDDELYQAILHQLDRLRTMATTDLIPTREEIEAFDSTNQALDYKPEDKGQMQPTKSRFEACIDVYSPRRVLFRTTSGYLGLGPDAAKPGDAVVILAGARTPFVMSPSSRKQDEQEKFTFVGECYIHGVMHGEAVSAEEAIFKPIVIR